jgi:hypothetical protein
MFLQSVDLAGKNALSRTAVSAERVENRPMPLRNPRKWWRQTRLRSWLAAALVAAVAVGGACYGASEAAATVLGIPLRLLIGVIVLPFALAFLAQWLALRQERLDRDHSVWEGR